MSNLGITRGLVFPNSVFSCKIVILRSPSQNIDEVILKMYSQMAHHCILFQKIVIDFNHIGAIMECQSSYIAILYNFRIFDLI